MVWLHFLRLHLWIYLCYKLNQRDEWVHYVYQGKFDQRDVNHYNRGIGFIPMSRPISFKFSERLYYVVIRESISLILATKL